MHSQILPSPFSGRAADPEIPRWPTATATATANGRGLRHSRAGETPYTIRPTGTRQEKRYRRRERVGERGETESQEELSRKLSYCTGAKKSRETGERKTGSNGRGTGRRNGSRE